MTRGRPKGSTSFARIKLSDLIKICGPEEAIVVGVQWLKDKGHYIEPAPIVAISTANFTPVTTTSLTPIQTIANQPPQLEIIPVEEVHFNEDETETELPEIPNEIQ